MWIALATMCCCCEIYCLVLVGSPRSNDIDSNNKKWKRIFAAIDARKRGEGMMFIIVLISHLFLSSNTQISSNHKNEEEKRAENHKNGQPQRAAITHRD